MLGDAKLDSLDTRLEQFKLNNAANQNDLQTILKEYSQLLDDYKTLKIAYDAKGNGLKVEELEAISNIKHRNPYILVLVDGNGYVFNDELVRDKEEGGMRAARMLNDAVEKHLRESLPQAKDSRIIVRIYADLTNLSKQLARSKIIGLEKRSICPFTAGFTRAINLFDFTDALDEEGTKFKIRESFKLAVEDGACSHIFFAACHDSGYYSQLVPYTGNRDKVTLVQGAGFNSDFHTFGLNVTQFPTLFRWSELASAPPNTKAPFANKAERKASSTETKAPTKNTYAHAANGSGSWRRDDTNGMSDAPLIDISSSLGDEDGYNGNSAKKKTQQCKFFQKGFCRFGDKCNFIHPGDVSVSQQKPSGIIIDRSDISSQLPTAVVQGFIPINKNNQRIDTYVREPTQEEWVAYNARFHSNKPCNNHHLQGMCTRFGCPYDHNTLEPGVRHCLEYVVKCSACPRKSACRSVECIQGHLCQKNDCVGQAKGCKMKTDMHNVDPRLASMVPAEDEEIMHDDFSGVPLPPATSMGMW
ncbi:hypothetical protein P280DRAFT_468135 [Massarina eburnea CBS 473.64]|uniref:C3H1-type domain-containing protein n=1 Tax=Massarina eburnea CBS 473.64 TaxID=1395130 RepID=A0A6A6S7W7_9PLEO|nr:hypothetical protein P280DRAFT_468135 [Massarina eburnea CBS 473.64]